MNKKDAVYRWIDDHTAEVAGLLQQLIQAPSVNAEMDEDPSYKYEQRAQECLKTFLDNFGMETEFQYPNVEKLRVYEGKPGYYPDHKFDNRPNLLGTLKGQSKGKSIMLSGHMDVVPRGTKWTHDPFGGEIIDGKIYGRGACDMKGGITCMVMAAKAIAESGMKLKGDVKVGTVVDEEAGGMGTLALIAEGNRADACLITEATNLQIAPLCRGILWGKIVIDGRSGSIEMKREDFREGGPVDAIEKGRMYLKAIKNLNQEWAITKQHKYMTLPCQINVAEFHAGEYPTTYANHCEIVFDAQYLPSEKDQNGLGSRVKKELENFVSSVAETDPWLQENPPHIEWMIDADCGETLDDQPFFQQVVKSAREIHPSSEIEGIGFHTDMGWFCRVGIPTMNIGPGNPRLDHHSDEYIEIKDLVTCTKMIASIIMDWCEISE